MKTTLPPRGILSGVFVLVFSLGLFAQTRLVAYINAAPQAAPVARDLNATLAELMKVAPATDQDLTGLHQESGIMRWVTFWRRDSARRARITAAVHRNLQSAVPNLVHDAQASGGSITATFKLFNDLSVVCESLDSLLSDPHGSQAELTALSNDLSDMNRIREELSSHILQAAAVLESRNPELVSSAGRPKKIIVDDNVSHKPKAKKHRPSNQ